jgi:uncharacterized alpha-E superfamily protein
MVDAQAFAVYETSAALERAEASARVLAARARVSRRVPSGTPGVFAALAACGPDGLVPPRGAGAAHLLRYLESAARAGVDAGPALPGDVVDALTWAAADAARQAAASSAMDPQEVSRSVRRQVAVVRGLMADTMRRDGGWELARLGTYLPRAGWVSALIGAAARLAGRPDWVGGDPWEAVAAVVGADRPEVEIAAARRAPERLLLDGAQPFSPAFALGEVEAALLARERGGRVTAGALAMARGAQARLRRSDVADTIAAGRLAPIVDDLLDALGAVAAAAVPSRAEPNGEPTSPAPPLRRIHSARPSLSGAA